MSNLRIMFTSLALGISLCVLPGSSFADTYTVKSGDNLWKISREFNTTIANIESLNNLSSTMLKPGQQLQVSGNDQKNVPLQQSLTNNEATVPASASGNSYTVQSGDTLWKIARDCKTTIDKIQAVNNLDPNALYPGQKILLPEGVVYTASTSHQVSRSSDRVSTVLDYAKKYIGVPYASGGSSPRGFDCSGYVKYVYGHFGIDLPRTAAEQYNMGQKVSSAEAKPGDFVVFKSGGYISHIGIYLGGGKFISATSSRGIAVDPVHGSYWGDKFLGFSRIV